jgi:hypothetical protein
LTFVGKPVGRIGSGQSSDATATLAATQPASQAPRQTHVSFYLASAARRDARLVTADRRLLRRIADTRWARSVVALSAAL